MIKFRVQEDILVASYTTDNDYQWLFQKLTDDEAHSFHKTFTFQKDDLISNIPTTIGEDIFGRDEWLDPIDFNFATLNTNGYFKIKRGTLIDTIDVFLHKDLHFDTELFYYNNDISIFKKIENVIDEDIYIGGDHPEAITEEAYRNLLKDFPTPHEMKLYVSARVASAINEYFSTTKDAAQKLQNYLDKKLIKKATSLPGEIFENEYSKFVAIRDKLITMLDDKISYTENVWQDEILEIILLLYPKYIRVFKSVPVRFDGVKKQLDLMLVDANGSIDIIEIKKPARDSIMSKGNYRDNFIPLRELSGTVMQIEKYIYYLNRWGYRGEKQLTERYSKLIPEGMEIKITNPSGLIIMGREDVLSTEQRQDFEVVKRKYKNVVDIITYDSLLKRLSFIIDKFTTTRNAPISSNGNNDPTIEERTDL